MISVASRGEPQGIKADPRRSRDGEYEEGRADEGRLMPCGLGCKCSRLQKKTHPQSRKTLQGKGKLLMSDWDDQRGRLKARRLAGLEDSRAEIRKRVARLRRHQMGDLDGKREGKWKERL